ncbi:MAG TPA: asparagine synthase (glutamine-hydrolyzing) [Patescibacteria group bacterium]|nr:asparagine synthase (glutamine-hydrolyzing) [Patescibacteria group bacterium]
MCGIVGIVCVDPRDRVDEMRLVRMRDALRHRGPDGAGLFVQGSVGLGHRRLAILDLAGGRQPMSSADGALVLVHNGETYNHPLLRRRLEARGHRYRTRSDTETILHLYEEEGDRVVDLLSGMFAFALWDRRRERLLLARDRLGIKPLYYAVTDREILFASEIKAILAAGAVRARFNDAVLPEYLASGFVAGEETFFRGVRKLPPGCLLTWSAATGVRQRRYWRLPDTPDRRRHVSLSGEAPRLLERLRETVRGHLLSDVPVGVLLSGGIDSSAIAALAAPLLPGPLHTFSVGFAEPEANELAWARQAAGALGARHHEVVLGAPEFFAALPRLVWHEDEPIAFPSSVPLHFVSRLAARHVKVVLTGEGADELFLGYNRYRVTRWNESLGRLYRAVTPRPLRGAVRRGLAGLPGRLRRDAGRTFLALEGGPRQMFYENFSVFPERLRREILLEPGRLAERDPHAEGIDRYRDGPGDSLGRMSRADLGTYLVELLMKQDQMSMAASIESRVPFLDHELVEYVFSLPSSVKLRGLTGKAILRRALRGVVPRPILERRKMGFPVPFGRWLRGPLLAAPPEFVLGPRARERRLFDPIALDRLVAEHATGAADHGQRLWLLTGLEIWMRIFVDGEEPERIGIAMPRTAPALGSPDAPLAAASGAAS